MPQQLESAFEILHYNQNLVQFADSKANTLILINSIALASSMALPAALPVEWRPLMGVLRMIFLVTSVCSVGLCLSVVLARIEPTAQVRRRDLVFFADILARPSVYAYSNDYLRTDGTTFLNDLIDRNYRVAAIASRKYHYYTAAQHATVCACGLWMVLIALTQTLG